MKATKKDILQRSENGNLSLNTHLSGRVDKNISIDFEKVEFEVQLSWQMSPVNDSGVSDKLASNNRYRWSEQQI